MYCVCVLQKSQDHTSMTKSDCDYVHLIMIPGAILDTAVLFFSLMCNYFLPLELLITIFLLAPPTSKDTATVSLGSPIALLHLLSVMLL